MGKWGNNLYKWSYNPTYSSNMVPSFFVFIPGPPGRSIPYIGDKLIQHIQPLMKGIQGTNGIHTYVFFKWEQPPLDLSPPRTCG